MSTTLEPETTTAPAEPAAQTCPNCGAEAAAGQLMCLECGSRLALEHRRPASWKIAGAIIGVVLLLAGAALALALAEITSDADNQATAPTPTQQASAPQAAPAETGTAPTESSPTPSTTDAAPSETTPEPAVPDTDTPPPTPADASPATWPEGKSAHTVILASAGSRQEAEAKQKQAQDAGISAGILKSDDFGSLRPGYWVVFDGQFDSVEEATARAEEDRGKGFADAYPRFVDPS